MIIENLNIYNSIYSISCLTEKLNVVEKFLTNAEHISAIGLFVLGIFSYTLWKDKIKKEKLETIKIDLVYSLIDLISTLEMHCHEDPCVSSYSESDNIYKELFSSNEVYQRELHNIDIEITNKIRTFNKYVELFNFYNKSNNQPVENSLIICRDLIRKFSSTVYLLVIKKYAMYSNIKLENLRTDFYEYLKTVKKELKDVLEKYNKLLKELKDWEEIYDTKRN